MGHLQNVNIFTLSGTYDLTDEIGEKQWENYKILQQYDRYKVTIINLSIKHVDQNPDTIKPNNLDFSKIEVLKTVRSMNLQFGQFNGNQNEKIIFSKAQKAFVKTLLSQEITPNLSLLNLTFDQMDPNLAQILFQLIFEGTKSKPQVLTIGLRCLNMDYIKIEDFV